MTFNFTSIIRKFTTISKNPRVCIVGAGPAGFYAAMHLTKNLTNVKVDIIEKLPVPFGLIRYGVAPDHPEVKNVINQFSKVAQQPNVKFYGNITLGKDIHLAQLRQHYDAVLLTYGAEEDRHLGIENEDANNVIAARNFVGWYNGLPSDKDLKVDLSGHTAVILGQGNVALDITRILLMPIDDLRKTDITEHALAVLSESNIKELYLVGRRGPLNVAFTIKELREQLHLKNCKTVWRENDFIGVAETVDKLPRPRKRLTELMLKSLRETTDDNNFSTCFRPVFYRSPNKFLVDDKRNLVGVELTSNKVVGDEIENQKSVPTDKTETLNCNIAFRSIGYRSVNVDKDIECDSSGRVKNDKGRVIIDDNGCVDVAKVYVSGWLGTGPVGVILHTMADSFQVAKRICQDISTDDTQCTKGGFEELKKCLKKDDKEIVDWIGWEKINKYEIDEGKKKGKPREKVCDINKMIEISNM